MKMNTARMTDFLRDTSALRAQVAALCWRMHRGQVQVLLITSRDTKRWVLPKGWPVDGLTAAAAAVREAWEEAGVKGQITAEPLGCYGYDKVVGPDAALPCVVTVFGMRVKTVANRFPEQKQRRRKWFSQSGAALLVAEPALQALLRILKVGPGGTLCAYATASRPDDTPAVD